MAYKEFYNNKEIGKIIQFAYDLHKRNFEESPILPRFEFYEGARLYYGKKYKDGGMYGQINFNNHSDVNALVTLLVMSGLDKNNENPQKALLLQTKTGEYNPHFFGLSQDKNRRYLKHSNSFNALTDEEKINMFIDCLVYLGFIREDIMKVINHEMAAREAYQHVAPEKYKDRQWICYYRKFYEFDKNIAIKGEYGNIFLDEFPFPFEEQPILDCSKVETACARFGINEKKVKLININSNPNSIVFTDIREAIIDEVIDASKVKIYGTIFGEQKVINLDKSIDCYETEDIALADTGIDNDYSKNRIKIFSDASDKDTLIEGLNEGAEGIGLFRNEAIVEKDSELIKDLLWVFDWGVCDDDNPVCQKIYSVIFQNCDIMYSAAGDKNIIFRLTNFDINELFKKQGDYSKDVYNSYYKGAELLLQFNEILCSEAKAIIQTAKKHHKTAKILVPYICDSSEFETIKILILETAKNEEYTDVEVGAMIETKQATIESDEIAKNADFIAIGTNDLTESVLNKRRSLDDIDFSILNEEVKKAINKIVYRVKRTKNIPIHICGEHTNYGDNLEYLLSLNIDGITVHPNLVKGYNETLNRYYENKKESSKALKKT